ncbi:MAG: hypothetical protein AMXMBFR13_31320 [Phycisphaerae bacterium]
MKLKLPAPRDFDFRTAVCSHGFFVLAPNEWVPPAGPLQTTVALDDNRAVAVQVSGADGVVSARSSASLSPAERRIVSAAIRRMLRLDEDLSAFHALCEASDTHRRAAETRFGRLLRSATLFEDIVKVICTCNVAWRQTVAMVNAMVSKWGIPVESSSEPLTAKLDSGSSPLVRARSAPKPKSLRLSRSFPTPLRLARVRESTLKRIARVGYRAPFIAKLARDVADGRVDLEAIERFTGPSHDLHRRLRQIRGVGDYAAGNLAMLLGRYDRLAVDTEMLRLLREREPGRTWTPAAARERYAAWKDYAFLAYWFELWEDYSHRHGRAEEWWPQTVGAQITRRPGV